MALTGVSAGLAAGCPEGPAGWGWPYPTEVVPPRPAARHSPDVRLAPSAGPAHFGFLCPGCDVVSRHRVDADTLAVLATLLPVEELEVPDEALETHVGPALTEDDLIDLMVGLDAAAEALSCRL